MKKPLQSLVGGAMLVFLAVTLAACGGGSGGGDGGSTATPSTPTTSTYSVGGSASNLNGTLVLQNNAGDDLTVSASGAFTFPAKLADKATYAVTVKTQPSNQTCTITNGTGTIAAANVSNVSVSCVDGKTVSGILFGLEKNASIVLQNNSGDDLTLTADGAFTFATALGSGVTYSVTARTQPSNQVCTITNGTGTMASADITNVSVSCPVNMPTLADYNIASGGFKTYVYNQVQTGTADTNQYLQISSNGKITFLGVTYNTDTTSDGITKFFNDQGADYGGVACDIFGTTSKGLYVGKSGTCTRTYKTTGTDTQNWSVDSVVDVTVMGTTYKALKLIAKGVNTINGNWTNYQYYVPSLFQVVLYDARKDDGTVSVKLTLTAIQ